MAVCNNWAARDVQVLAGAQRAVGRQQLRHVADRPSHQARLVDDVVTATLAVPPAMRAIRGHMREGRPAGMSVPQFRALLYVRRHPGTGLSEIADHLGTSVPAASELVGRLVRQDLVVRATDPGERRRIQLTLSSSGDGSAGRGGRACDRVAARPGRTAGPRASTDARRGDCGPPVAGPGRHPGRCRHRRIAASRSISRGCRRRRSTTLISHYRHDLLIVQGEPAAVADPMRRAFAYRPYVGSGPMAQAG